jgi:NADPH-dependent curcumin reductase CurA
MPRCWYFVKRPVGPVTEGCFELREIESRPLKDGSVRVANRWLSVDPSVRWRMDAETPLPPLPLGGKLNGPALGEVVESRSAQFHVGDVVTHLAGWRDEAVLPAEALQRVPDIPVPESAFLGVLGYPGVTAYFGLYDVARVRPGDVVFISAGGGAVGTAAIQMAKAGGMTVVASAGGPEKCALARKLGADVTIDYKGGLPIATALREAAPSGIDVYFDNVGGDHLDAALATAKKGARFAICGMVSGYNSRSREPIPHLDRIISAGITLKGFEVFSFADRLAEFYEVAGQWIHRGALTNVETVRHGLENTPQAFLGLFTGENLGKLVVCL